MVHIFVQKYKKDYLLKSFIYTWTKLKKSASSDMSLQCLLSPVCPNK